MQVGASSSVLAAGTTLGDWELVTSLADDGEAHVWLVRQRSAKIEKLHVLAFFDESVDARLRHAIIEEAEIAAGIIHPNVARVVDVGREGDSVWIVREHVDGDSLADLSAAVGKKKSAVPPAMVLRILADACAGLHAAHLLRDRSGKLLNAVHGGVTAKTIMVGTNGAVRVVGFGVSKARARVLGSPNAAWRGQPGAPAVPDDQKLDRHADVWAIGAIMRGILHAEITDFAVEGAPPILRELANRALATDPVERFATAAEMQGAIEASMVTLGMPTTSANVATFVAAHMLEHVSARGSAIEAALESLRTPGESLFPRKDSIGALAHTLPAPADRTEITQERFTTPMALPANALFTGPLPMSIPPRRALSRRAIAASIGVGAVAIASLVIVATRGHHGESVSTAAAAAPIAPVVAKPACSSGMVEIPGGHFFMGSDDDLDLEKPAHHVTVASYCMDVFEVTVDKYKQCSDAGDCKRAYEQNRWDGITKQDQKTYDSLCNVREPMARAQHPINCVDWSMAEHYCEAHGGRLPTEAEWEFAARGPDGRKYPWGDEEPSALDLNACGKECVAWGKKNKVDLEAMFPGDDGWANTAPVGSFPAGKSRYGVQDVVGNVWEWTGDHFAAYTAEQQDDPKGPKSGSERVIRGGAWNGSYPAWVRPTFRYHNDPDTRSYGVGFRCMKPITK